MKWRSLAEAGSYTDERPLAEVFAERKGLIAKYVPADVQAVHAQHRITCPLLVDADNELARQFGLVYRVPEEQQAIYRRTFVNLPFVNGDDRWELPIPATYVIDCDGTIRFAS